MACMTVWHEPHSPRWYDEGMRRTLRLVAEAGFTHINWNPDAGSSYHYAESEIGFIAGMIRDHGLIMHSLHASNGRNPVVEHAGLFESRKDIASPHAWQRLAGIDLLKNRIDLAHALGCPNVVLHIDLDACDPDGHGADAAFLDRVSGSLDLLRPYALARGVAIALENIFGGTAAAFAALFDALFGRFEPAFLGLCYDSGHANIVDRGGTRLLAPYLDRLIATHLHDNFGARDDHLLPFDGTIDWPTTMALMAQSRLALPVTFETPPDRYHLRPAAFYARAFHVATRLAEMTR